jgi:hypothetical protein
VKEGENAYNVWDVYCLSSRAVYIRVHDLEGKAPLLEIRNAIMGLQSILNYPYSVLPNILLTSPPVTAGATQTMRL